MSYYITTSAAMRYYMLATQSGNREVGGYAKFHRDEHDNHIITDMRPLRQASSECYFEIDEKVNAQFLEELVASGEDPADWSMLFHTHPSGMSASMSGVDVKQISEMATDLPGQVARSMILAQGKVVPTMHEAVCVDGRVFMRDDVQIILLDETGAIADLKSIGWNDKPVAKKLTGVLGFSVDHETTRTFNSNDGWYDESPELTEVPSFDEAPDDYSKWLDEKYQTNLSTDDRCAEFIGDCVHHNGQVEQVVDAYDLEEQTLLVLSGGDEVWMDEVKMIRQAN